MKKLEKIVWTPRTMSVAAGISRRRFSSVVGRSPKSRLSPDPQRARRDKTIPASNTTRPNRMPFSEREKFEDAGKFRVVRQQPLGDGKHLGEKREGDELKADDDGHARHHQRARRSNATPPMSMSFDRQRARPRTIPSADEQNSRREKQPARREQQHEPQMPPAVAPRFQVRRARPPVRVQRDGHLGDFQPLEAWI